MADSLREKFATLVTESARQWHGWAHDIGNGRAAPQPRAILDATNVLGIANPAEALESDAAVIEEVSRLDRAALEAAEELTQKLKPWGGKLERLDSSIEETAKKLAELKAFRSTWTWSAAEDLADDARTLRLKNPRLFPMEAGR